MKKIKKAKLRAAVFEEAARLIGQGAQEFACRALSMAATGDFATRTVEHGFFEKVLKPTTDHAGILIEPDDPWYSLSFNVWEDYDESTARILGLLLCAQLVKEGWE